MPEPTPMTTDRSDTVAVACETSFEPVKIDEIDTEAVLDADGVGIRAPSYDEGALMWEIAREAGSLEVNSPYAYLLQCRNFQNTCAIAEVYGRPAGFVITHRVPERPAVLFVWQIAVLPDFRGMGIAKRLLDGVLGREANTGVHTVEATVTPSNKASAAFFASFAKSRGATLDVQPGFAAESFPDDHEHEAEQLYAIAPVASIA